MKNKTTKITLKDDDSAIVLNGDGKVSLFFKNGEYDRLITFNERILSVIGICLITKDEEFMKLIDKKFDDHFGNENNDEK